MDIKKLLGAKISNIRKSKGYSQAEFAEKIGISTNALSIIETGNGFLTAETLEKILREFNLDAEELFSFGKIKSTEEVYNDIVRILKILRNNQSKLNIIYNVVKNIV